MKASPLKRLVDRARMDENFLQLLFKNRKEALKQAASEGIKLSPEESELLRKILAQQRVVLTLDQLTPFLSLQSATERVSGPGPGFWPISCELIIKWIRGAKRTFRKRALRVSKPLKAGPRGSTSTKKR
jgi:hypothetical protein